MKFFTPTLLICLLLLITGCNAPSQEENEVRETLEAMFTAMKQRDIKVSEAVLIDDGQYHSFNVNSKVLSSNSFSEYINSLSTQGNVLREELIPPTKIYAMDHVATLISKYKFYVNDELSHHGEEIFTFVKLDGKWVITGSVYTIDRSNLGKDD